jgi:predicted DCC family thiol-disulfide oxidoreductase YuxK
VERPTTIPRTFYNASCPVCSAGVAHIRRLTGGRGDDDLLWFDITTQPNALAAYGADLEAVKKRLHVIDRHGMLQVGIPAFAALWEEIPRYRVLATLVRLPVVRPIAAAIYELFAALLYAWNKRRERRRARACGPAPQDGGRS